MNPINHAVERAEGFITLGLHLDAWETLEDLPPEAKNHPRVLELRLEILCREASWHKAVILGESLAAMLPESAQGRFWLACALCQTGRTGEAKEAPKRALELDAGLRARALDEPLLGGVW